LTDGQKLIFHKNLNFPDKNSFQPNGTRIAKVKLPDTPKKKAKATGKLKIMESTILLNLISHPTVTWTFIKLGVVYKYIGLLV